MLRMALSSGSPCGPLTISRLSAVFACLCFLYIMRDAWMPSTPSATLRDGASRMVQHSLESSHHTATVPTSHPIKDRFQEECLSAPGADRVMVILKTGAAEIYDKLPTQLVTLFRCTPHYLIFSDLALTLSDYPIHDALATVRDSTKNHHEDFEIYRKLSEWHGEGQNLAKLKGRKGWDLDKWKFLPMMHETYRMSPTGIDWFVYIEADTSLSWSNLLYHLRTLDPSQLVYTGAQNLIENTEFAHGGSGFILSRAAAKALEDERTSVGVDAYDEKWETLTAETCCGDELLAQALMEVGVPLLPAWPRIQGETVNTLDWTPWHWCSPAISWHHVSSTQVDAMWQYQKQWVNEKGWDTPYLYKDVFDDMVARHISVNRTSWNNLSQDFKFSKPGIDPNDAVWNPKGLSKVELRSVDSIEDCAEVCRSKDECVQWMWQPGRCQLGKAIRLGSRDDHGHDDSQRWYSGWLLDRVEDMRDALEPCSLRWLD